MSAALASFSAAALTLYNDINACQYPEQLDAITSLLYERYGAGQLNDAETEYLQDCITRRRPLSRRTSTGMLAKLNTRISRFAPRPCRRRLSDEERTKRRQRKRRLGGSSALPDTMRHFYTEGERAVLCIVAGEVKRHGVCDLTVKEIGDRAGVSMTTVQNALHEARRLGHVQITERPQRGRKNLPNVVRVASREWRTWIARAPSAARTIGSNSLKTVSISESIDKERRIIAAAAQAERPQGALQRECRAGAAPPNSLRERGAA